MDNKKIENSIITDELRFYVRFSDGRAYVCHTKGEWFDVTIVQQGDQLLVWRWIGDGLERDPQEW